MVPIGAAVEPFTDIKNSEYETTTASTARARSIFPPGGLYQEYSLIPETVNSYSHPCTRIFNYARFAFAGRSLPLAVTMLPEDGGLETNHGSHSPRPRQ